MKLPVINLLEISHCIGRLIEEPKRQKYGSIACRACHGTRDLHCPRIAHLRLNIRGLIVKIILQKAAISGLFDIFRRSGRLPFSAGRIF